MPGPALDALGRRRRDAPQVTPRCRRASAPMPRSTQAAARGSGWAGTRLGGPARRTDASAPGRSGRRPTRPGGRAGPGSTPPRRPRRPGCSAPRTGRASTFSFELRGDLVDLTGEVATGRAVQPGDLDESTPVTVAALVDVRRRTRTQTRRGRMNSEPSSPSSASTTPSSAIQSPGLRLTCSFTNRLTPSKVIEPEPVGQLTVWPSARSTRSGLPSGLRIGVRLVLVQGVDRLRHPVVQARGRPVGEHRQRRVLRVREGGERSGRVGEGVRRVELALEAELRPARPGPAASGTLTTPNDRNVLSSGRNTTGPE